MTRSAFILAPLVISALPAVAQPSVRGAIRSDSNSRAIGGVAVTVDGPVVKSTKTDSTGWYFVGDLAPGRFTVKVRAVGFKPIDQLIELRDTDTLDLDIRLTPAPQSLAPVTVTAGPAPTRRRTQNVIAFEEIDQLVGVAANAFELVKRLRPGYFTARAGATLGDPNAPKQSAVPGDTIATNPAHAMDIAARTAAKRAPPPRPPMVSIDEWPPQDLEILLQLPATQVAEIRFMTGIEATTRFGMGFTNGVILVLLK